MQSFVLDIRDENLMRKYACGYMETYITICKIGSQREFAVWLRKLKWALVSAWRGGMGRETGGGFKREGVYVHLWLIHVEV